MRAADIAPHSTYALASSSPQFRVITPTTHHTFDWVPPLDTVNWLTDIGLWRFKKIAEEAARRGGKVSMAMTTEIGAEATTDFKQVELSHDSRQAINTSARHNCVLSSTNIYAMKINHVNCLFKVEGGYEQMVSVGLNWNIFLVF